MAHRLESRLQRLEQKQAEAETGAITIIIVDDDEWYGNDAHRLAREAERNANGQSSMVDE